MSVVCVIPARFASRRFPQKMLAHLMGRPLLQWVWEAATALPLFDRVVFAVDHPQVAALVASFGGESLMTAESCLSGTDRLIELMQSGRLDGEIWVNWQGDEPFITREMVESLLQSTEAPFDIWSLKKRIVKEEERTDPNVVKVVTTKNGEALYFSRFPIPYDRDKTRVLPLYKHIGIYAYRRSALETLATLSPSPLELSESLEQLRYLEHGLKMQLHETEIETVGIDHPSDLERAASHLASLQ